MSNAAAYRILTIDDNAAIHEDYRKIFAESSPNARSLASLESTLFGDTSRFKKKEAFELVVALQGQEGLEKVQQACAAKRPFTLAFVDVRMPPGWDGVKTVGEIWKVDPDLQIVLCTAYSDYSWNQMRRQLGNSDSLVVLKKPFDNIEVLQLAHTLTRKWELSRQARAHLEDLNQMVSVRTRELELANEQLKREMAERAKAEGKFIQAQKMEAVGRLAAGVAHDLNNILTVIGTYGHLLPENPSPTTLAETKRQLLAATDRGAALTRQLLSFCRKQPVRLKPVDLNRLLRDSHKFLGRLVGEHITLNVQTTADLPCALADECNVEQILMNLAANARDAMPDGGTLTLAISQVCLETGTPGASPEARPGSFLCLTVRDSGCGIDSATLQQLFEPFYTTKAEGLGTGLGLATVHAIVKQHGGWVEVASEIKRGTTFRIYLPVTTEPEAPAASLPAEGKSLADGKTVLLVEDDCEVRQSAVEVLRRQGCLVVEASDALDALKLWPHYRGRVDLLLTDVIMPHGIDGRELARRLQAEEPRLRVLYTSGYGSETAAVASVQRDTDFISKPYSPLMLATALNTCFEQPDRKLSA